MTLITLSMFVWWGCVAVNFFRNPSILLATNGAVSHYALNASTAGLHAFGFVLGGLLMLLSGKNLSVRDEKLRTYFYIVGACSVLLPFFRINGGVIPFAVHMLLAATVYICMSLCVLILGFTVYRTQYSAYFATAIVTAYTINLLSFFVDSPEIFDLPFDQLLVVGIFGLWVQLNMRRPRRMPGRTMSVNKNEKGHHIKSMV